MKALKHILTCGGIALMISSCASNLSSPAAASSVGATSATPSSKERAIAERIFNLINSDRTRAGKRALRGNQALNKLAQKHSVEMVSLSTSQYGDGMRSRSQYANLVHSIESMSELTYQVPAGSGDPASTAVSAWLNSPNHRRVINQSWDMMGVGVNIANGKTYITMSLGARPGGVPRGIRPVGW